MIYLFITAVGRAAQKYAEVLKIMERLDELAFWTFLKFKSSQLLRTNLFPRLKFCR